MSRTRPPTATVAGAPGEGPPPAAIWLMPLAGLLLGVDAPDLAHAPFHRLLDVRAACDPREHVGDDERREHFLRRRRHRTGIAEEDGDLVLLLERRQLRIAAEAGHRLRVLVLEERHVVAAAGLHRFLLVVGDRLDEFLRG